MTTRDRIELVVLAIIWGASFLFMRIATPEFGPVALVEIRVAVAAVFLLGVLAVKGGVRQLVPAAAPLTLLGIMSSALPFVLFAYVTLHVTAGTAAVLNATAPLFGALVAYVWLRDRLSPLRILGLIVGFAGVVLLVGDGVSLGGDTSVLWAAAAGLAASLSYGIAVNYTKRKLAGVAPLANATGTQVVSTILLLPLALLYWPEQNPSALAWLCVIALGVVCTGVAYIIYFRLIARIGPARAITVTYLVPVFGMLWGLVFLDERITVGMLAASAAILMGVALATGTLRRSAPTAAPPAESEPKRTT